MLGLISRHVVLYQYFSPSHSSPTYAIILIQDQCIFSVQCISPDRAVVLIQVSDVLEEYADWHPLDFEHVYISPGMVDFNVYRNTEWENVQEITQAAVSGGVTLLVEERDESIVLDSVEQVSCDLGVIQVLSPDTVPDSTVYLAAKGYLTSPRANIAPITDLKMWLSTALPQNWPVLLDTAMVEDSVLYYSSPCRMLPYTERTSNKRVTEYQVFAGGFNADEKSSGSSSESPRPKIAPRQPYHRHQAAPAASTVLKHVRSSSWGKVRTSYFTRSDNRKRTYDSKKPISHTIISALQAEILKSADSMESLIKAEMMQYRGEGKTVFKTSLSTVLPDLLPLADSPKTHPRPLKRPRPSIQINTKPLMPKDCVYLFHLAQYPDSMELRGVEALMAALQAHPRPVHICNLSSANAIVRVHQAREMGCKLTCETCPHFLYFTDKSVQEGDTRFKNFPPIRNSANCNFLLELLTMNQIKTVCSQHRPVPEVLKCRPYFTKAVCGVNGLGFTMQVMWTLLRRPFTQVPEHYLVRLAKWTAYNPAQVLGLRKRGSIAPGMYADLIIWDPFQEQKIEQTYSRQQYQCPYLGQELYGAIRQVYVRGKLAYDQGSFHPVGRLVSPRDEHS